MACRRGVPVGIAPYVRVKDSLNAACSQTVTSRNSRGVRLGKRVEHIELANRTVNTMVPKLHPSNCKL